VTNKASVLSRTFYALVFFSALLLPITARAGLTEFFSATGKLSLSVDAGGSNRATGHVIEVEKPNASATVRSAFVLAASTGFSNRVLNNGDVSINGTPITWNAQVPGPILNSNHRADVTAIIKPVVDAAAPGRVPFIFTEVKTTGIDGEILAVIFDDPAQAVDTTVTLLFGAQDVAGDAFSVSLAEPLDPNAAGAMADMGLGISFSCQPGSQLSLVDVNAQRVSSSAGGKKPSGPCRNGQLIAVGGINASNVNPGALAAPQSAKVDDGLYSLLPFISAADTEIAVSTRNPSNDDNIFFAFFQLSAAAVARSSLVLSPASAANHVGAQQTLTATATQPGGAPAQGAVITFNVISGPNQGENGAVTADANGQAIFTYTSNGVVGADQVQASFADSRNDLRSSNIVTINWSNTAPLADPQSVTSPEDTAKDITLSGSDTDDDPLTFTIVSPPQHGTLSQPSVASSAQRSKAQQKVKARLQKDKKKPGTMASALGSKALAAIVQSLSANTVTYTPDPDYNGPDSFTFKVNDGTVDSAPATVNITVTPGEDNPEIQNLAFARRDSPDPGYSTPGIAALLEYRDKDGDFERLRVSLLKARNVPKGCGPGIITSDDVSIFPFSENRASAADPFAFVPTEIKTVEIGPEAMAVAAANNCAITLELTAFHIEGFDDADNNSNVLSGTFSIDSDTGPSPGAASFQVSSSRARSAQATKKIAAPVIR